MKARSLLAPALLGLMLLGCSEFATEAANSGGFGATDINGTWREASTGLVMRIDGVNSGKAGSGRLTSAGTAYPSSAVGGYPLKEVEHQSGGYWDAYHYTYTSSGQWNYTHVVGLAMTSDKKEFKIGSAVYRRQ